MTAIARLREVEASPPAVRSVWDDAAEGDPFVRAMEVIARQESALRQLTIECAMVRAERDMLALLVGHVPAAPVAAPIVEVPPPIPTPLPTVPSRLRACMRCGAEFSSFYKRTSCDPCRVIQRKPTVCACRRKFVPMPTRLDRCKICAASTRERTA